jgi:hypothetical protein
VLIGDIQGCFLEFQARYFGECAGEGLFGFLPQFAWIGKLEVACQYSGVLNP